jgi:hypothetical protein
MVPPVGPGSIYSDVDFGNMNFFGATMAPPPVLASEAFKKPQMLRQHTGSTGTAAIIGGIRGIVFACFLATLAVAVLIIAHRAQQTKLRTQGLMATEIAAINDPHRLAILQEWSYLHGVATQTEVRQALVRVLESELAPTNVSLPDVPAVVPPSPSTMANDPFFTPG